MSNLQFTISAVDKFSGAFKKLGKQIKGTNKLRQSLQGVSNAGLKLGAAGGGILFGMNKLLGKAETFQSTFSDVAKVLNGYTEKEIEGVKQGVLGLTRVIPMYAEELNAITEAGAKMGLPKDSLLGFTEIVAKSATALGLSTDNISASFGKISGIYGVKSTEGLKEIGDVVNYLADNLETEGGNIIEIMKRIGANAVNLNIAPNVAAGISAAFDKLGVSPEKSATAFNSLIDGLSKTARFKKILETEGEGGLRKILTEIAGMEKSKRSSFIQDIAGSGGDGVMLKSLTNDINIYIDALDKATDKESYNNSLQREFEAKSKTLTSQKILLANAFGEVSIAMTPFIEKLAEGIKKIVPHIYQLTAWIKENKDLSVSIAKITAGLGAVLVVGGTAMFVFGKIAVAVMGLVTALKVVIAVIHAFKIAMISTGLGAVLVGIGIASALIYTNWDLISKKVREFGNWIMKTFPFISKIADVMNGAGAFSGGGKELKGLSIGGMDGMNGLANNPNPNIDMNVEITDKRTELTVKNNGNVKSQFVDKGKSKAGLGGYSYMGA